MTSDKEKVAPYAAWLAVCFFWGTTYLAIRVGLETLPPAAFAGLRFLTAGVLLFGFAYFVRKERLPKGREWLDLSIVGVLLLIIGNGLVVWAEQWLSSGMAALLVATSPFWVAGFELMNRNGERLSPRALTGMLIGFGGLVLLVAPELAGSTLGMKYLLGVIGLQIACAAWSGGSVYAKQRKVQTSPLMSSAIQMLIAGLILTVLATALGEVRTLHFSTRSAVAFAYLVLFGSIVAYGCYTYAVQTLPLSLVSTYSYVNPVIAVLLGWAILREPLGWRVIISTAIILVGVALVKTAPKRTSARPSDQHEPELPARAMTRTA
jgi:drug/metabolite transporter (DMT)-like permease